MKSLCALLLLLLLTSTGLAQANAAAQESAVRAADKAWAQAAASKDVERMLSFYDEDASFIANTGAVITGREELRRLWSRFFTSPGYELSWQATKVEVSGDLAYSFGAWEQTELRDGQPRKTKGTYLAVWKKQADGSWRVLIDKP